ncbi:MAG: FimB/Mfa2 family fimbrial subunit [Bacteroidales bacterium]|nr:FimB/Mfa2 family fimbrial subunit [Bacteroidales bacterium]
MNIRHTLIVITVLLSFGSCIKEDLSDYLSGHYICFDVIMPEYKYKDIVSQVDLYLYDENGNLVKKYVYLKSQLSGPYYMAYIPKQNIGNYTIVALINHTSHYATARAEKRSTLRTSLIGNRIEYKQDDIYHACQNFVVRKTDPMLTYDTMRLSKNTNNINLTVEFEDYTLPENSTVETYIHGNNGTYDYNNKPQPDSYRIYIPHTETIVGHTITSSGLYLFRTMRIWMNSDLRIQLEERDKNNNITAGQSLNIADELAKITVNGEHIYDSDEKLEYYDEFDFKLTIGPNLKIISLKINDWYAIKPDEEI